MKRTLRSILSVVAGAAAAVVLIGVMETAGHLVYPPPAGIDMGKPETIKAAMAGMPVGAFLSIILGWGVGTFGGAWVAARLAGRSPLVHGLVIGVLSLSAGVAMMVMMPHPLWVCVLGVAVFLPAAYLGAKAAARRPEGPLPAAAG